MKQLALVTPSASPFLPPSLLTLPSTTRWHPPPQAYFLYAEPTDSRVFSDLLHRQTLYIVLIIICQVVILVIMNYLTYYPYGQLMKALQSRGFIKPGDKPTLRMVMIYYAQTLGRWWRACRELVVRSRVVIPHPEGDGKGSGQSSPVERPRTASSATASTSTQDQRSTFKRDPPEGTFVVAAKGS